MRTPELRIAMIENLGQAQYLQGKVPVALETWNAGATLAEKLEKPELRRSILERASATTPRCADQDKQKEIDQQLAAAGAQAKA